MPRAAALLLPTLAVLPLGAQEAADTDWRAFRGTDGTATSAAAAPLRWSDEEGIAWRRPLPGPGSSSPIVVGDAVFVTCWSGYGLDPKDPGDPADLRRHLLRIAAATGEVVWSVELPPAPREDPFEGRITSHGYASSTPVSDGERIWVFFGKAGVFAFDLDGEKLWHADVGSGSSEWNTGSGSSPTLHGGRLFVNASDESHAIVALDAATGERLWTREAPQLDQAYATPVVASAGGRDVVLVPLLEAIWALDPESGELVWNLPTKSDGALAPTIVVDGGLAFSFGGQTGARSIAFRIADAAAGKAEAEPVWTSRYGCYVPTPLVADGHLHWVERGIAFCARAADGELVFRERLDGGFYASVVRAGDALYAQSQVDGCWVYAASPKFELIAQNRIESDPSRFHGTPAITPGRIYLRSDMALYAIGAGAPPRKSTR